MENVQGVMLPNTQNVTTADNSDIKMAEKGLSGRVVKEVVLPESTVVETPSYLIDLRNVKVIHRLALQSLKSLVRGKPDDTYRVPVYLFHKTKTLLIGYGEQYTLYSTLKKMCNLQFNADVYLNQGDGFKELSDDNVFGLRLDL